MTVKIDAIGLVATDFRATLAFYERLGCDFGEVSGPHAEAHLGGVRLMVDDAALIASFAPGPIAPRHGVSLAAQLGTPAEVDALYAELTATGGGELEPFDAEWGQRYATVHDPDGTSVDLYAWLPGHEPQA